jgi:membrane protease YdiL (CAAX protease family)
MQDNPGWIALYSLTIVAVLVEFPLLILLTRILIARERARGQLPADTKAIPYRRRQPLWMWLVATGLILVVAVLNMAATPPLTAPFAGLQAQMPDWAVLAFEPRVFARAIGASPELFWFMWLASLPALMLAGGIAQEVYFRGYLLPRMPRAGLATPLINAGLFSVFHLTSPWAIVARLPYVVVFSLMAWWRKSLNLAIWIHAGMGILLFLMGTAFLLIGIARSAG